jgi:hypothetical protein
LSLAFINFQKAIIAIPNNIIINVDLVRNSEIKVIIEENPDLFSESRNNDADFNTLAIYILYRLMEKGK